MLIWHAVHVSPVLSYCRHVLGMDTLLASLVLG